jgi:hypothetical protein
MSKNLFQDMVKVNNKKSSSSNISKNILSEKTPKNKIKEKVTKIETPESIQDLNVNNTKNNYKYRLWVVAIMCIVFLFVSLSYFFGKVTVNINPKIQDLILNQNLSASANASPDELSFNLVVISGEENKKVSAEGEKEVSVKAEGSVLLYNTYSKSPQTLNIDTRLEGSNGKIYLTKTKTTVPGMSKSGVPGSVRVDIYAKDAGAEYNSDPLDFKILGFKGTAKYAKFYGRSEGKIKGGLKGVIPSITEAQQSALVENLKSNLETKLLKKATDQIPDNFILFKDAAFLDISTSDVEITSPEKGVVDLKLKGTLYGILFNIDKITKSITKNNISDHDSTDVYIHNIKDLVFTLSNKDAVSFTDVKNINFALSGDTKVVYKVDGDSLIKDLLDKSKKDFNNILLNYPNIESADLVVSPIWRMSLPDKKEDIKVIINYPE